MSKAKFRYIAVVDDQPMFRKGLASLINLFPGYKVLFDASNGVDFIRQLRNATLPDIVLLDIVMPEMDGYKTANWLRSNYPNIKILALSTMDTETSIIKMINNGAVGYVLKDAEPKELQRAFDDLFNFGFHYNEIVSNKVFATINHLKNGDDESGIISKLSDREISFIQLACTERTYLEIAKEMSVSERTVDGYREAVFKKLQVGSRVGLIIQAIKKGLVVL